MTAQPIYPAIEPPAIGDGSATKIADGVFWLRMPMAGSIEAINLWALADDDGWTIVDTGLRTTETAAAWRQASFRPWRTGRCGASSSPISIPTIAAWQAGWRRNSPLGSG